MGFSRRESNTVVEKNDNIESTKVEIHLKSSLRWRLRPCERGRGANSRTKRNKSNRSWNAATLARIKERKKNENAMLNSGADRGGEKNTFLLWCTKVICQKCRSVGPNNKQLIIMVLCKLFLPDAKHLQRENHRSTKKGLIFFKIFFPKLSICHCWWLQAAFKTNVGTLCKTGLIWLHKTLKRETGKTWHKHPHAQQFRSIFETRPTASSRFLLLLLLLDPHAVPSGPSLWH